MIDTHCHLTFPDFAADVPGVLSRAREAGVTGAITISTTSEDCLLARATARENDRVWCTAGVHPLYADRGPHAWENIRAVGEDERCVAWGELGLDKHYDTPAIATQRSVLKDQLAHLEEWSRQGLAKPVVLHCRKAFDELIPMLEVSSLPRDRYVFHCFTGTPDDVRQCLDFGAMVSFTGVVTYRNAPEVREAAKLVPIDRIMVETDAPYLSPEPMRGTRPCEPAFVAHTARFLAELRGEAWDEFHAAINANTARFFGIDAS
ncbi:MAG: TatD family hydrolase [Planctomycetota bacterium]